MFKIFPQFSKLTFADRKEYENSIKQFPPVADISFVSMLTWWDVIGSADVATLNGNLVISYWIPGDEEHSGLSLIGTNKVEESMCAIFDYLQEKGECPRLVNVPEFVVHHMQYPELFRFTSQRSDDEYVIPLSHFSSLKSIPYYRRAKIKRFMKDLGHQQVTVKSVDLSRPENRRLLLDAAEEWPRKGFNDLGNVERKALARTVGASHKLGEKNLCLFVDGELEAYCLYHASHDERYIMADHARVNYDIPGIFDYMAYGFSRHMQEYSVAAFVNLHADMGFAQLRVFKLALRPCDFFRKYVIEPIELTGM